MGGLSKRGVLSSVSYGTPPKQPTNEHTHRPRQTADTRCSVDGGAAARAGLGLHLLAPADWACSWYGGK